MYFEKLLICNYGPLPDLEYTFSSSGINVILGNNGAGKTQLAGAIIAALMGPQQIRLVENYTDKRASKIELSIREDDRVEIITFSLNAEITTEEYNKLTNYSARRAPDSLQSILVKHLVDPNQLRIAFNPNEDFSLANFSYESYFLIDQLLTKDSDAAKIWERIKVVFVNKREKSNQIERLMSEGQRKILRLAQEFISRTKRPYPLPLILDDPFFSFDKDARDLSLKMIKAIAEKDQVILLTHDPYAIPVQLATKHYHLLQHKKGISPIYYKKKSSSPIPYIVTEGKTDWKHIKAALKIFHSHKEYRNLEVEFIDDEARLMGSAELLKFCEQTSKIPQPRPIICVFDRDEENIIKKVMSENGSPKHWGNNVFSFIIPLPPHRNGHPEISIEFYYLDKDIMRFDSNNRRLFVSDEFDPRSGRHFTENLNCTTLNKLGRYTIIDSNVFDAQNNNIARSKDDFASAILNQTSEFKDVDFKHFKLIFELIQSLTKQHDSEY